MDWQKILKAYMEQVYQAEGRYACHVQFSGPVDKKLSNEERAALMAINEELTRTHDRWLSIEDHPPPKIGWYAVIRRFRDRPDRFPPGSGYWDGTSWDHGHILSWDHGRILARSPQVFGNQNSAECWAYVHQWLGSPPFATTPAKAHLHSKETKMSPKKKKERTPEVKKKKERTPEVKAARSQARVLAQADGRAWGDLSKEEKVSYLRKAGKPQSPAAKARAAAKSAGQNWRELSKEQRQQYLKQVREK